jgi:hypothetical protein
MVVLMSFKTRVPPETFAEELCNSPEIALAIMQAC